MVGNLSGILKVFTVVFSKVYESNKNAFLANFDRLGMISKKENIQFIKIIKIYQNEKNLLNNIWFLCIGTEHKVSSMETE